MLRNHHYFRTRYVHSFDAKRPLLGIQQLRNKIIPAAVNSSTSNVYHLMTTQPMSASKDHPS